MLRLLDDPDFDMTTTSTNGAGAVIVLHTRTPEMTGFLVSAQIRSDIRSYTLSSDVEADLRRRNTPSGAKPGTYTAVTAFYTNLTFSARIVVADAIDETGTPSYGAFEKAYPKARGFARAYLPGYSKDGTRAVVRVSVGPSPHGSMVTASLARVGEKWMVKWHRITRYA